MRTRRVVWIVEMFTDRCGTPNLDFIGSCCCEKHSASVLCRVYLQSASEPREGGEAGVEHTARVCRVAPACGKSGIVVRGHGKSGRTEMLNCLQLITFLYTPDSCSSVNGRTAKCKSPRYERSGVFINTRIQPMCKRVEDDARV